MITDQQLKKASYEGILYQPLVKKNPNWGVDGRPYYVKADELVKREVFIKPGEAPEKAIKRFMGRLKPKAAARSFPKSFKSTEDYFAQYARLNPWAACLEFTNLSTSGFAVPQGEEVIYEEVDELVDELI